MLAELGLGLSAYLISSMHCGRLLNWPVSGFGERQNPCQYLINESDSSLLGRLAGEGCRLGADAYFGLRLLAVGADYF